VTINSIQIIDRLRATPMALSRWLLSLHRSQHQQQQWLLWNGPTSTAALATARRSTVLSPLRYNNGVCFYHTRAHPKPIPLLPIPYALDRLLRQGEKRKKENQKMDERLQKIATLKGKKERTKRGYPDETIELALNLNLDPRKPGQSLRGSLELPHGTGKPGHKVLVFTTDEELTVKVKEMGAQFVGGAELVDQVLDGTVSPGSAFTVALATMEMIPILTKKGVARILGPRGLMPNVKSGTAVENPDELLIQTSRQLKALQVEFRTEKEGAVHLPVGKQSFGTQKLLENIGAVMATIFDVKPESYGKGKKKSKNKNKSGEVAKSQPKYLLSAYLSSTQGKGLKLDLRTVDPTSPFFLGDADLLVAAPAVTAPTTTPDLPVPTAEPTAAANADATTMTSGIDGGEDQNNTAAAATTATPSL
jgi:large subunit ribosomal protein L1